MADVPVRRRLRVTRDQVEAARALIELRGGPDKVEPIIAKLAQVPLTPRRDAHAS